MLLNNIPWPALLQDITAQYSQCCCIEFQAQKKPPKKQKQKPNHPLLRSVRVCKEEFFNFLSRYSFCLHLVQSTRLTVLTPKVLLPENKQPAPFLER